MNEDMIRNVPETELSPEEFEAIDRILAGVAAEDDSRVDYSGMLRRVKEKAREQGIVVFPAARAKKRGGLVKRIALGAATAAAVFVVGLAALLVLKTVLGDDAESPAADVDAYVSDKADSENAVKEPVKNTAVVTSRPLDGTKNPGTYNPPAAESTSEPADPAFTLLPDISPLPTEFPTKGGSAGYVELESFESDPSDSSDLVPADLPTCMNVMPPREALPTDSAISAEAYGEDAGKEYSYTCTVVYDLDVELGIGVAMYKYDEQTGHITYIWRISEEAFLVADFDGFTPEEAQELLASLTELSGRVDGFAELLPAA